MNHVLLLNRNLTITNPPTLVQGWRGEQIGISQWNPRHGCHTLMLTVEKYNEFAQSLSEGCHLVMRRWMPLFQQDTPPAMVKDFKDGYEHGMDSREPDQGRGGWFWCGFKAASGWTSKAALESVGIEAPETAEDLKEAFENVLHAPSVQSVNSRIGTEEQLKPYDGQNRDGGDQMRKELAEWEAKETLLQNAGEPISTVTHHKTLHRIAKAEGIDLSQAKTQKAMYEAVIEARGKRLHPAA